MKSELTNILTLDTVGMDDQCPGRGKAGLGILSLPELQVERPIKVFDSSSAFNKVCPHTIDYSTASRIVRSGYRKHQTLFTYLRLMPASTASHRPDELSARGSSPSARRRQVFSLA